MSFLRRTRKRFKRALILGLALFLLWQWQQHYGTIRFIFPVHGQSSWYSRHDPGIKKRTANNEIFNDQAMTCAMWGVPFNTKLRVINEANGKSVVVRVNDRGPHRRYVRQGRVIDLTKAAFRRISSHKRGLIDVTVEKVREK